MIKLLNAANATKDEQLAHLMKEVRKAHLYYDKHTVHLMQLADDIKGEALHIRFEV